MGAAPMVQRWTAAVNHLFAGTLHGHTVKALACFSFAMCLAGHCHAGRIAAWAVSAAKPASSQRRWERLVASVRLEGSAAIGELAASLLRDWHGGRELLLVLDETPNGQRLRCLRLGVAYRKRMLSLAAECYPANRPPLPMPKLICRMLRRVARLVPGDVRRVTLLCDRGLSWPAVLDCVRQLGWGHVVRLQRSTRVMLGDGRVVAAAGLVQRPGGRPWRGRGVQIFKKAGWRRACLSVRWDRRCDEPWILAANPTGRLGVRAALAYLKRGWCEQSFRDDKSSGFQWARSHVRRPRRAMRVLLVMVLATLLSISLGTWLVKSGRRRDLDPHRRRRLSFFQLSLRWLHHRLGSPGEAAGPLPPYLPHLHPS